MLIIVVGPPFRNAVPFGRCKHLNPKQLDSAKRSENRIGGALDHGHAKSTYLWSIRRVIREFRGVLEEGGAPTPSHSKSLGAETSDGNPRRRRGFSDDVEAPHWYEALPDIHVRRMT